MLAALALSPAFAAPAHAAEKGGFLSGLFSVGDIAGRAVKGGVAWLGYIVLTAVSSALGVAGHFFDAAVKYGISPANEGVRTIINDGWVLSRDVANLCFIFILLYISIATILQLSGYGAKDLLARVIVIALLVNFSLMITNVVVDASNVLAMEFYGKLENIRDASGNPVGLSAAVVSGLNPQTLFDSTPLFGKKMGDGTAEQLDESGTLMQIFIITAGGSVLLLVAAFSLFAAGLMFVIRTVVLWLLMILSPLAFLAMALPRTKQYASKWWSELFNQSFYAPIYLFLFYFVVKLVVQGSVIKQAVLDNYSLGSGLADPDPANVKLILNFVVVITLMLATLTIAKMLGGASAETGLAWAEKAKKWGQGYAGRVSKRYAAPLARRAIESEGRVARTLRKVPFAPRRLAKLSLADKAEISKYEKMYSSYSPQALAAIKREPKFLFNRAQLEALRRIEKKERKREEERLAARKRREAFEKGTIQDKLLALLGTAESAEKKASEAWEEAQKKAREEGQKKAAESQKKES